MKNTDSMPQGEELSKAQKITITRQVNTQKQAELEQFVRDKIVSYYENIGKKNMNNSIKNILPSVISTVKVLTFKYVDGNNERTEQFSNEKLSEITDEKWNEIIKKAIENKVSSAPVKGSKYVAREGRS